MVPSPPAEGPERSGKGASGGTAGRTPESPAKRSRTNDGPDPKGAKRVRREACKTRRREAKRYRPDAANESRASKNVARSNLLRALAEQPSVPGDCESRRWVKVTMRQAGLGRRSVAAGDAGLIDCGCRDDRRGMPYRLDWLSAIAATVVGDKMLDRSGGRVGSGTRSIG